MPYKNIRYIHILLNNIPLLYLSSDVQMYFSQNPSFLTQFTILQVIKVQIAFKRLPKSFYKFSFRQIMIV